MKYLTQQTIDEINTQLTNSTIILLSNFLPANELAPYLDSHEFITYNLNDLGCDYYNMVVPIFLFLVLEAEGE